MSFFLYTEYKTEDDKSLNTTRTGHQVDTVKSSTGTMSTVTRESSTEQIQEESSTEPINDESSTEQIQDESSTEQIQDELNTVQIQDESNIMRQMMYEPRMNSETKSLTSRSVQLIPKTRAVLAGDEIKDEEESWEDFEWETSTQVTIPPSLFENVGGEWGDDFQEEWEEGWK